MDQTFGPGVTLSKVALSYLKTRDMAQWRVTSVRGRDDTEDVSTGGWRRRVLSYAQIRACGKCPAMRSKWRVDHCPLCELVVCEDHLRSCSDCDLIVCMDCLGYCCR